MKCFQYLIILVLALSACECPPSADAPKKIIPTEYSRICVLNSVHNTYSINIDTKYGNIFENLLFRKHTNYEKIGSGNNFINLKYNIFEFYKVAANFGKNAYYTFIPTGNAEQVQTLLVNDDVERLDKSKAYIRIINSHLYLPNLKIINIELKGQENFAYREYTAFLESSVGMENFKFFVEDSLVINLQVNTQAGNCYTIVPFYSPREKNIYGLTCSVIELPIP